MSDHIINQILSSLRARFQQLESPARAEAQRRYFKEPVETHGLSVPQGAPLPRPSCRN